MDLTFTVFYCFNKMAYFGEDQDSFKIVGLTLRNSTFLDYSDIVDYIYELNEDQYQYALEHIYEYPEETRIALLEGRVIPEQILANLKYKVVNITDEMTERAEKRRRLDKELIFEERLKQEVFPPRPLGEVDEKLDELHAKRTMLEKNLNEYTKKTDSSKAYVPPAARKTMLSNDPGVIEIQRKIESLENEIKNQERKIVKENEFWLELKKHEFRNKFNEEMLTMQEEGSSCY